jgi:hypothetical protein
MGSKEHGDLIFNDHEVKTAYDIDFPSMDDPQATSLDVNHTKDLIERVFDVFYNHELENLLSSPIRGYAGVCGFKPQISPFGGGKHASRRVSQQRFG